jgi:hypothetical protein
LLGRPLDLRRGDTALLQNRLDVLFGLNELLLADQLEIPSNLAKPQSGVLGRLHFQAVTGGFSRQVAQFDGHLSKQPIFRVHGDPCWLHAG